MTCAPQRRISHAVLLVSAPVILAKHTSRTQQCVIGTPDAFKSLSGKASQSSAVQSTHSGKQYYEDILTLFPVSQKCWEATACWRRRCTVNKHSHYLCIFGRLHIFISTAEETDWSILSKSWGFWLINQNSNFSSLPTRTQIKDGQKKKLSNILLSFPTSLYQQNKETNKNKCLTRCFQAESVLGFKQQRDSDTCRD